VAAVSRSRPPKCSCGRGCWVCGDAGAVARERDEVACRVDEALLQDEIDFAFEPQFTECDGRDCWLCSPAPIKAEELPPGVTFTEAP
jgi:hypothetical protein